MEDYSLHKACLEGSLEEVKELLDRGYSVNAKDFFKRTPLHCLYSMGITAYYRCATQKKRRELEMAKFLLDRKADPNSISHDGKGLAPLHQAVANRNYPVIRLLLEKGAEPRWRNGDGKTPLHLAARNNFIEAIDAFCAGGVSADITDYGGRTPLHDAVCCNHDIDGLLDTLAIHGFNIDWVDVRGRSPLHYSVKHNRYGSVDALLKRGARVDLHDVNGFSPLHYAVNTSNSRIVESLLKHRARIDSAATPDGVPPGQTPLHLAVKNCDADLVKLLLSEHADINICDENGETALHVALRCTHREGRVVASLLNYSPRLDIRDSDKNTVIDIIKKCDFQSSVNNSILHYASLLKAMGSTSLDESDHSYVIENHPEFYRRCVLEVEALKNDRLFFLLENCVIRLSYKFLDDSLVRSLLDKNFEEDYPTYSKMLRKKIKLSYLRSKLLKPSENRLFELLRLCPHIPSLPPECYHLILDYFGCRDLNYFIWTVDYITNLSANYSTIG